MLQIPGWNIIKTHIAGIQPVEHTIYPNCYLTQGKSNTNSIDFTYLPDMYY